MSLLEVEDLKVHFVHRKSFLRGGGWVKAVDGVSFAVNAGETVGLVGESGSGKTTLARAVLRLIPQTGGAVRFDGRAMGEMTGGEMRALRSQMQIVFQDPYSSLNPRMTIGEAIGEALYLHNIGAPRDRPRRIAKLLERVGLPTAAAARYPHEFSGGQRQRVGIARALAVNPRLLVADEPVSALDVSIQAQILNLLSDLQAEMGLAILFIGHDLSVIEYMCERVVVLYLGRVMESGPVAQLYSAPRHPYTRALLDAAPVPDPRSRTERMMLKGDLPSPLNPPSGCVFRTRCPYAIPACADAAPTMTAVSPDHDVACIRAAEINLARPLAEQLC